MNGPILKNPWLRLTTAASAVLLASMALTAKASEAEMAVIQHLHASNQFGALLAHCESLDQTAKSGSATYKYVASACDYRVAGLAQARPDNPQMASAAAEALSRAQQRLADIVAPDAPVSELQAESLALLSGILGMRISNSPALGPFLGMKAGAAVDRAEAIAPHNPRVQLFKGIGKMFTPALFGGSKSEALASFDAAIAAFPATRRATDWGLDDAYIWRAILLKRMERPTEAQLSLRRALAVTPEHSWAVHLSAKQSAGK